METTPGIFYRLRLSDEALLYVSPAVEAVLGYTPHELLADSRLFAAAMAPADWHRLLEHSTTAADGVEIHLGQSLRHKDGKTWRSVANQAFREPGGEVLSGVLIPHHRTLAAADECRLTQMVEASATPVVVLDREGAVVNINRAALELAGYARDEVIGASYVELFIPAEEREQAWDTYRRIVRAGGTATSERTVRARHGRRHRFLWTFSPIPNARCSHDFYLVSGHDLTELQEARERIHFLSHYDAVSGLPNRVPMLDRVRQSMHRVERAGRVLGLTLLNFAQLPRLSATHGAAVHEALVQGVGDRLLRLASPADSCGRDTDGSWILVMERASAEELRVALSALLAQLQQPFDLAGNPIFLTAHAGVAVFPIDAAEPEDLIAAAEVGRQQAQDRALAYPVFYTADLNRRSRERLRYENALRGALDNDAFRLHYQPLVDLRSGRVLGVEALLRWNSPELGEVPPDTFIPIAEAAGLMAAIGDWVLREACRQRRRWLDEGLDRFHVSINLSGPEFVDPTLPERVDRALADTGLSPHYLMIELTESASMDEPERSIPILRRLQAMGVRLAIDDFGTGYSNLSYLKRFPVDTLKIDRTFISDICQSAGDLSLVRTIIDMARGLHLEVVAEGVETEAQLALLRGAGCDYIQGHLFSRPLPGERIGDVLRENLAQPLRAPAAASGRTLLLLDDDPNIIASLRRMLRNRGYQLYTANTVADAFDILARHEIGVIVSDQRMPDLSGTEFFSRVKTMYPHSVRIILSGYTDLRTVTAAVNEGAIYKFITKPWEPEVLELVLSEAFSHYEKQRAERRLRESELRYRAIVEQDLEAICVFDPHGRLVEANAVTERLTGRRFCELAGQGYHAVFPAEDLPRVDDAIDRALREGKPSRVQMRYHRRGGSIGHADMVVVPLFDEDERKGKGSITITRDMTEVLETRAALHRREGELTAMFTQNLSPAFVMTLDEPLDWRGDGDRERLLDHVFAHERVTRVNQALLDQFGMTEARALGMTPAQVFAHDLPRGRELMSQLFDNGRLRVETEEHLAKGAPVRVEGYYVCLYDERGRITGHFGIQRAL